MNRFAQIPCLGLCLAAFLFAFSALPAAGDIVRFKNGKSMEGSAQVLPDGRVQVATSFGTMTFEADRVESIESARTLGEIVREALDTMPPGDVQALMEIASWCKDEGAYTLANELFQRALKLDPDQPEARRQLGYLQVGGRWLTADEALIAAGLVYIDGEWVSREEDGRRRARERRLSLEERRLEIQEIALELEAVRLAQEGARESAEEGGIPVSWVWVPGGPGARLPHRHRSRKQPSTEAPASDGGSRRERPQQKIPPGRQGRHGIKPPAP